MAYNFPELDNHMFVERELMLTEADLHEAQQEVMAQEAPNPENRFTAHTKGRVLTDAEAEVLINDYIRSDWSSTRMEDSIPY